MQKVVGSNPIIRFKESPAVGGVFCCLRRHRNRFGEVIELFVERETAERALRDALTDEPTWAGPTVVEISGHSLRAELTRASPGSPRPHHGGVDRPELTRTARLRPFASTLVRHRQSKGVIRSVGSERRGRGTSIPAQR